MESVKRKIMKPELDIFHEFPYQKSIDSSQYVEYRYV